MCERNKRCYNGHSRGPFGTRGLCTACEEGRSLIRERESLRAEIEQDRLKRTQEQLEQQLEAIPPYYHGGCF